jgi:hypothetical protein
LLPIPDETAKRFPFVDALTTTPQKEIFLMTVLLPQKGTSGAGTLRLKREGDVYTAEIRHASQSVDVRVHDRGEIPAVEVR